MEGNGGRGAALAFKSTVLLVFAIAAVFFVVQAASGARCGSENAYAPRHEKGARPLGEALYGYFEELVDYLTRTRPHALDAIWELAVGGEVFACEEGGILYLISNPGRVMTVDAGSGSILWSLDLGVWISAPPAAQAGIVYVGATDHVLYALDAESGALLWYFPSQGEILAQPAVGDGMVFFAADNDSVYDLVHRLYALDARSGTLAWVYDTESWTPSSPAIGDGAVYLGGYRREVYALEKSTGRELWSFKSSNIVLSSPLITSGRVLFSCIDGWVHVLEEASGVPEWSRKLTGFEWLKPAEGYGSLYACTHRNTLTAMALETGEELWTFTDGDLLSCSTLEGAEAVLAFSAEGSIYLLDPATGEAASMLSAPHSFASPPILAGNKVFASSPDGLFRAYMLPPEILP